MLTGAQAHLMLNHLPIVAFVFLSPILTYFVWRKREALQKPALLGIVLASLLCLPTFWTGEPAEEDIEHLRGVSEQLIEAHEEAAELALWFVLSTGVGAAGLLIVSRRQMAPPAKGLLFLLALLWTSTVLLVRTGHEGGKIRHPEITEITREQIR